MPADAVLFSAALVFVAVLLDAAISDLSAFRIPNRAPLLLVTAFVPAGLAAGFGGGDWLTHVAIGLAVFTLSFGLFAMRLWGGGDAKLVPAVALWIGPAGLARFILVMALAGGGLALLALLARRVPLAPGGAVRAWGRRLVETGHVPYGLAIAAAGLDWWLLALLPRLIG